MSESERPGRYNRSFNGLLGALVFTVVIVGAFVVFRGIFSKDLAIEPEAVDYLDTVSEIQAGGIDVVYPPALPDGWIATNVVFEPGERPSFGLSMLTDSGSFVGLRQEDASVADLLATYVDEKETSEEDPLEVDSPIATTWDGFSDSGGDLAYAAELGDDTILVFGSADQDDLRTLIELLTTDPVPGS